MRGSSRDDPCEPTCQAWLSCRRSRTGISAPISATRWRCVTAFTAGATSTYMYRRATRWDSSSRAFPALIATSGKQRHGSRRTRGRSTSAPVNEHRSNGRLVESSGGFDEPGSTVESGPPGPTGPLVACGSAGQGIEMRNAPHNSRGPYASTLSPSYVPRPAAGNRTAASEGRPRAGAPGRARRGRSSCRPSPP